MEAATLPERVVRSAAAVAGGAVYQATELLIPGWLRRSRFYQATIARMLRITVELVGGVRRAMPADAVSVQDLAVRKAAGNAVEFAAILTVGWSPLWMLAAASDITGGTRLYLRTLADDLKREGLLPADEVLAGALIVAGGLLLVTPGLLTDAVGLALLFPFVRSRVAEWVKDFLRRKIQEGRIQIVGLGGEE